MSVIYLNIYIFMSVITTYYRILSLSHYLLNSRLIFQILHFRLRLQIYDNKNSLYFVYSSSIAIFLQFYSQSNPIIIDTNIIS